MPIRVSAYQRLANGTYSIPDQVLFLQFLQIQRAGRFGNMNNGQMSLNVRTMSFFTSPTVALIVFSNTMK